MTGCSGCGMSDRSSSTSAMRRADESEIVSMAKTIESIIRLERICMV